MSEAKRIAREHSPAAILAALAVNICDRLRDLDPPRRIEVLQIAIALTAAEIQQRVRDAQQPRDE
jgi:hypothetical protein